MAKKKRDFTQVALAVVEKAIGGQLVDRPVPAEPLPPGPTKNQAAVELGRLGGKKGGKARAKKLTKKRRSEIAKQAAMARWKIRER